MKATSTRKLKSAAKLIDHATNSLLKGLKRDMLKGDGRIDRVRLSRQGYSKRLLDLLEQA